MAATRFNGSHCRCWCLLRSPRLRTDGTFHNRKFQKGKTMENRFLTPNKTYLNITQVFSSPLLHLSAIINNPRPPKCPLNLTQSPEPLCDIPATHICNCCLLVVDFSTWSFILFKIVWQAGSMAATIVAGVCEDQQDYDYDLIIPSKAETRKSKTELIVCLIKHHKTLCIRLFYTHKGLIKVAHVGDHLSEAVHPSRENFMTSCA